MRFILASNSPRRKELLARAGFSFEVMAANIDETPLQNEAPIRFVERMAEEKARAVAAKPACPTPAVILAADTVVTINGTILGKPKNVEEAVTMLSLLSGTSHDVVTGWCLFRNGVNPHEAPLISHEITRVIFRTLTGGEILDYVASGEPTDKAGAYAIQGKAAAFAERIDGLISNVVGLPIERVTEPLKKALAYPVK